MSLYKVEHKILHCPALEDVKDILHKGLLENFENASVEVISCPDLRKAPWNLAAEGLCGNPKIGEAGGIPYLVPMAQKDKVYDFQEIAKQIDLPNAFVIGAGAGPHRYVGVNSELITNLKLGSTNSSKIAKVDPTTGKCLLEQLPSAETTCSLLLNFFACDGGQGPVLHIQASKRKGKENFVNCLREALKKEYKDNPVGFGGTFLLKNGTAKVHVMPDFSETPLKSEAEVYKWLKFYDINAPAVFMAVALSVDPSLDIRVEHTHGHGKEDGGHYHFDTTPDTVEYEGYFNLGKVLYRIDQPLIKIPGQH